jgi:hypothetical protein
MMTIQQLFNINVNAINKIDAVCDTDLRKYADHKDDLIELLDDTANAMMCIGTYWLFSAIVSSGQSLTYANVRRWLVRMGLWSCVKIQKGETYRYILPDRSGCADRWTVLDVQYDRNGAPLVTTLKLAHSYSQAVGK